MAIGKILVKSKIINDGLAEVAVVARIGVVTIMMLNITIMLDIRSFKK
jgi:hypothetical protein